MTTRHGLLGLGLAALLTACADDAAPAPTGFQRYVPDAGTPAAIAYRAGITPGRGAC